MEQHSRSQVTITVAADATQDGTEQEQHGQQEDAAATVLLGHHTDADAAVTKQFVFLIDNTKGRRYMLRP